MLVNPEDAKLTKGSTKKVELICDYCGAKLVRRWDYVIKSHEFVDRDSCKKCSTKKREDTSLVKYGVRIPSQSIEIRKAASQTKGGSGKCVAEYHDEIMKMYNDGISINEMANKLNLGRTALRTYLENLGYDTKGDMQAKAQRTCKERYGAEHFLQSEIGQQNLKRALKEKYGSENPYENPEYKNNYIEKKKLALIEKYGVEDILNCEERREEHEKKRRETRKKNGQYIYDNKTVQEWAIEKGMAASTLYQRIEKLGIEEAMKLDKCTSKLEAFLAEILRSLNLEFKTEVYVNKMIADFHIVGTNILIEADGLYWHSDHIIEGAAHHARKRSNYIQNGYFPLFFREDEIYDNSDIVKSIIANKVGQSIKIGARTCNIKQEEKSIGRHFMKDNHLMGRGSGDTFVLCNEDEILSCMLIKRKNGREYEISRFAHKMGYNVVGGFSRLIKFAQSKLKMESLITYIDLRYGSGEYLKGLGFEHCGENISFKWTNFKQTVHRMQFPGNDGYKNGMFKIYDCGQAKYRLNF